MGSKIRSLGQRAAATCAAPPTASAAEYATSHCRPLLFGIPYKWRYMNVGTFDLHLAYIYLYTCVICRELSRENVSNLDVGDRAYSGCNSFPKRRKNTAAYA